MAQLLKSFDHNSPALEGSNTELSLRFHLTANRLQVAYVNNAKIFGIREYQLDLSEKVPGLGEKIISQEKLNKERVVEIKKILRSNAFTLGPDEVIAGIPGAHFRRSTGQDLPDSSINKSSPTENLSVLYSHEEESEQNVAISPIANQIVAMGFALAKQRMSFTLVHLNAEDAWIGVWKDKKMMFFNRFSAASTDDLLYFVSLALEQSKTSPATCPVLLSGELDKFSPKIKDIQRLMPGAVIPHSFFGGLFDKPDASLPTWKYGYLAF